MYYYFYSNLYQYPIYSFVQVPVNSENQQSSVNCQEITDNTKPYFKPAIISTSSAQTSIQDQDNLSQIKIAKTSADKVGNHEDDQYRPQPQLIDFKKNRKSKQMQNRNVVPNIIRLILSFIQKPGKSQNIIEKLLSGRNTQANNLNSKKYYVFQKMIRNKMDNYVNEDTLKELCRLRPDENCIFGEKEQRTYIKITRVLIQRFMSQEIYQRVLTSKRMEVGKKHEHIRAIGKIKRNLRSYFQQEGLFN